AGVRADGALEHGRRAGERARAIRLVGLALRFLGVALRRGRELLRALGLAELGVRPRDVRDRGRAVSGLVGRIGERLRVLEERERLGRARVAAARRARAVALEEPPAHERRDLAVLDAAEDELGEDVLALALLLDLVLRLLE